jgi:hypothetical protein
MSGAQLGAELTWAKESRRRHAVIAALERVLGQDLLVQAVAPGIAASMPTPEDEPVDATKWGGGADREGRVAPLCPIRENVPSSYD